MNPLVPFLSKSTLGMTARRARSLVLFPLAILSLLPAPVVANPISVTDNSGQLQIGLGTSNNNAAIVTTTGIANELEVFGTGFLPTAYSSINGLAFTFERSEQTVELQQNGLPFSSSLTSPILISGGGLFNRVDDNTASGGNTFDYSGFTGISGILTNSGAAPATLVAQKSENMVLSNTNFTAGTMSLDMSGVSTANLTHTGGSHVFESLGWTGTLSLTNNAGATLFLLNAVDLSRVTNNGELVLGYSPSITVSSIGGHGSLVRPNAGALILNGPQTLTGAAGVGDGGYGGSAVAMNAGGNVTSSNGTSMAGGNGASGTWNDGGSGGSGVTFGGNGTLTNSGRNRPR